MGRRIYYEESNAQKIYSVLRTISPYILLSFIGLLVWTLSYFILIAYKEILICYLRRNDKFEGKEFYYKCISYKSHIKNFYAFNAAIILFWFAIYLMGDEDWRRYCLVTGFYFFIFGYIICWGIYYKFYSYKNDFFDEFKFFIRYFKENFFDKKNVEKEKID